MTSARLLQIKQQRRRWVRRLQERKVSSLIFLERGYCLYYPAEYFPRRAKDQVALAAPNKLPSIGSRSGEPNPARTTADNGAVFNLTPEIYI